MISPILSAHDADMVVLDFGVFIAEQARTHRVSQAAIIAALMQRITPSPDASLITTRIPNVSGPDSAKTGDLITTSNSPSQPEVSSQAHAPAADTPAYQAAGDMTDGDRGSSSSLAPSPSVDPITETSDAGEHGGRNDAQHSTAAEGVPLTTDSPANIGGDHEVPAHSEPVTLDSRPQEPAAPIEGQNGDEHQRAERSETNEAPAGRAAVESPATDKSAEPSGSAAPVRGRKPTTRSLVVAVHAEHPEWPSKLIAEHLGISEDAVRATASRKKLKLVSWWDYERALKAKTTEALKTPPAGPQEPVERAGPPTPRAEPPTPPATTAALPMLPPVVKPMQRAPQGRFYLRDKTTLLFVHQSLQPSPSGHGPMMTSDRKWAWYDTMERFRGAMKKWPELANLRKEAASV